MLTDIVSSRTVQRTDPKSDTSVNLALVLRSGAEMEMSSVSHSL